MCIQIKTNNKLPSMICYKSIMKILCIQIFYLFIFFMLVERMLGGFTLGDCWWVVGWDSCLILVDTFVESIHGIQIFNYERIWQVNPYVYRTFRISLYKLIKLLSLTIGAKHNNNTKNKYMVKSCVQKSSNKNNGRNEFTNL